jgi:ABC-type bacteriocin/lantibiotic exporter with double-glycine peptidase domain
MTQGFRFQIRILRDLVFFSLKLRPETAFALGIGVVSSALEVVSLALLVPLTLMATHQSISPTSLWHRIASLSGHQANATFFIVAFFLCLFARTVTQMVALTLTNHVTRQLNATFSIHALEAFTHHLSFETVQKGSIGHFISIAGDESVRAAQIVGAVVKLVPLACLFLLYALMIARQSPVAFLGIVAFITLTAVLLAGAFRKSRELGWRAQSESRNAGTHFIDTLNSLRTVRSLNAEKYVTHHYEQMMRQYMRTLFQVDTINSLGGQVPTLLLSTGMVVAVWLIAPATLLAMLPGIVIGIMMVLRLLPLASQAMDITLKLTSDLKAAENISEVLDSVQESSNKRQGGQPHDIGRVTRIEFENVSFGYDENLLVLNDLSFTLNAGKTYAIVGPSGAGKSTVIDLLLKFYVPQSGCVLVNGENSAAMRGSAIRKHLVLVEQTPRTFSDTIASNIRFGYQAADENIQATLAMVGLDALIASLPQGIHTPLAYQGNNISGGQRQRISLARALLRNADVLILDESTSALDEGTRERMLAAILPRYRDRIIIFISHDPAILRLVDEVIRLPPPMQSHKDETLVAAS